MQPVPDHLLNRLAQQQLPWEWAWTWFSALPVAAQHTRLSELVIYIQQAHPTPALVQQAVAKAPVKQMATPLVLLRVHPLPRALARIQQLPASEYPNSFRVLLSLFRVADTHRRVTECQGSCSHEWHNLSPLSLPL